MANSRKMTEFILRSNKSKLVNTCRSLMVRQIIRQNVVMVSQNVLKETMAQRSHGLAENIYQAKNMTLAND